MKKIACLFFCASAFIALAENESIVGNGRFDSSGIKPWRTSVVSGKFNFTATEAEGAVDGKALNITCTGAGDKGNDGIWARAYQKINVTKGLNYEVKVRYKTLPGFNGKFELWVRPGYRNDDVSVSAADGWQEFTTEFIAKNNEVTLYLTLVKGTGTVLVDEIRVTPKLVGNNDFAAAKLVPWYNSIQSGKFTFAVQNNREAGNGKVLNITCTGDNGKGVNKIWGRTYQHIKVTKGKKYRFNVRFQPQSGFQGRFEFWVRSGQGKDANRTITAKGKEGWQEINGFFAAASDKAVIYLTIRGGVGTVLIDKVCVEEIK